MPVLHEVGCALSTKTSSEFCCPLLFCGCGNYPCEIVGFTALLEPFQPQLFSFTVERDVDINAQNND